MAHPRATAARKAVAIERAQNAPPEAEDRFWRGGGDYYFELTPDGIKVTGGDRAKTLTGGQSTVIGWDDPMVDDILQEQQRPDSELGVRYVPEKAESAEVTSPAPPFESKEKAAMAGGTAGEPPSKDAGQAEDRLDEPAPKEDFEVSSRVSAEPGEPELQVSSRTGVERGDPPPARPPELDLPPPEEPPPPPAEEEPQRYGLPVITREGEGVAGALGQYTRLKDEPPPTRLRRGARPRRIPGRSE